MALIAMAVYDTVVNERSKYTWRTLESLMDTSGSNNRIIVIDNNSCDKTKEIQNNINKHLKVYLKQLILVNID